MDKQIFLNNIFNYEPKQTNFFTDILKNIKCKEPTMLELGCAEAAYSELFNNHFLGECKNICIDVLPRQIEVAKKVCEKCLFYHGYIGELVHLQENVEDNFGAKKFKVVDLLNDNNILKLNILHMDIQGSETYVLKEILDYSLYKRIEYFFVSTHGEKIHNECLDIIKLYDNKNEFIFNSPTDGGLGDGLIILKNLDFNE